MYSPKIREDLIPKLYRLGQKKRRPMTRLVAEAIHPPDAVASPAPRHRVQPRAVSRGTDALALVPPRRLRVQR